MFYSIIAPHDFILYFNSNISDITWLISTKRAPNDIFTLNFLFSLKKSKPVQRFKLADKNIFLRHKTCGDKKIDKDKHPTDEAALLCPSSG